MPRKKTLITTPYPTSEEIARTYGIPMSEVRRIEKAAELIIEKRLDLEARKRVSKRRQAAGRKKTTSSR